jgi:flagellum-specific peptidoglycan hydrolase FlgJ
MKFSAAMLLAFNQEHDYVSKYKDDAIKEMKEFGIPASITLAQGIIESASGTSELATKANNHFGIKCSGWQGETYRSDDDLPNECFRKYPTVLESYRDHSIFLHKKRYESLFKLKITDYKGWAKGLKRCGYATNPEYAQKLISKIELHNLAALDTL